MIICPFKDLPRYIPVIPGLEEALDAIRQVKTYEARTIPLSGNNRIVISTNTTRDPRVGTIEAHRQFLDIQYVVEGWESVGWADVAALTPDGDFDLEKDIGFYKGNVELITIPAGYCYVVFPEDAHMPTVSPDAPHASTKMVVKLRL